MKNVGFGKKLLYIILKDLRLIYSWFIFLCIWVVLESCKCLVCYISCYVFLKNIIFDNGLFFVVVFLDIDINGTFNELESFMILEY